MLKKSHVKDWSCPVKPKNEKEKKLEEKKARKVLTEPKLILNKDTCQVEYKIGKISKIAQVGKLGKLNKLVKFF